MNRRSMLALSVSGLASGSIATATAGTDSLAQIARAHGLMFGCAVQRDHLLKDPSYAGLVAAQSVILTPEWEMKWGAIEVKRGVRDYSRADWIVDFAERNNLAIRGHAAVWQTNLPKWAEAALQGQDGDGVLRDHISGALGRYAGRINQWDVVNEAIYPANNAPGGLARTVFYERFGRNYIRDAFLLARAADPYAKLYYNDENFFYDDRDHAARRESCLELLQWLLSEGTPVEGLGIESHLIAGHAPFSQKLYADFLASVARLGLEIMITEFDVNDRNYGPDTQERDQAVADHATEYLDVVLEQRAVKGIVTWGISDRYTWLNGDHRWARTDGLANRCLPFDEALQAKSIFYAIADALARAPNR